MITPLWGTKMLKRQKFYRVIDNEEKFYQYFRIPHISSTFSSVKYKIKAPQKTLTLEAVGQNDCHICKQLYSNNTI